MSFPVEILSLYRDEEGVIWVGTKQDGVYRLTGSAVQPVLQKISVPGAERLSVHCIRKDPTGRLWLGTSAKVSGVLIRMDQLLSFILIRKMAQGLVIPMYSVWKLIPEIGWIGTSTGVECT